jgi:transcriptional regulator with XRE-family HTH domain
LSVFFSSAVPSLLIRNKYVTLFDVTTNHLICAFLRRVIIQMKRLGLNQTQLAKRMKVSRPYVTKLLSGDVNITFGTALRLAQALQMDFFPDLKEKAEPEPVAVPAAT